MGTTTRSLDEHVESSGHASTEQAAGTKHGIDETSSAPNAKRSKTEKDEEQNALETTISDASDVEHDEEEGSEENPIPITDTDDAPKKSKKESEHAQNGRAEASKSQDSTTPASILEKGIVYFFFRGRVNIDEPSGVKDIARSYIVLRPIDEDSDLGEGPIGDAGNSRLIAIPKKVLPRSGRDRWIAFVEKANASFETLKDEFLASSEYETKTAGTRHKPAATPVGEGVYAITTTGRESHLAYILTLPSELSEVQRELGLRERGSFIISTRNPDFEAPANARLPQGPKYTQEVKDEFRGLRWIPSNPRNLDFANAQFLLVGEPSGVQGATGMQGDEEEEDADGELEDPLEELEKLEDEDTHRMEAMKGDDSAAIFADLEVHSKNYPRLQTTF
ncbi:hypothetical protein BX600DRAFT_506105 [Xylariales sp. PMI_506]|nr:hypothetical protein BX600DRAFT_506105 [Xylariales sp. PMI_506]